MTLAYLPRTCAQYVRWSPRTRACFPILACVRLFLPNTVSTTLCDDVTDSLGHSFIRLYSFCVLSAAAVGTKLYIRRPRCLDDVSNRSITSQAPLFKAFIGRHHTVYVYVYSHSVLAGILQCVVNQINTSVVITLTVGTVSIGSDFCLFCSVCCNKSRSRHEI